MEYRERFRALFPEKKSQNLALTVVYVPYSLDSGTLARSRKGEVCESPTRSGPDQDDQMQQSSQGVYSESRPLDKNGSSNK